MYQELNHYLTPLFHPMKLWQKENTVTSEKIERFTVGRDREMDLYLKEV